MERVKRFLMTKPQNVYHAIQQGLRDRLFDARQSLQASVRREVTQREIGESVARALGEEPAAQATISRWFKGELRDTLTLAALADVCGVRRAWLMLNEGPMLDVTHRPSLVSDETEVAVPRPSTTPLAPMERRAHAAPKRRRKS